MANDTPEFPRYFDPDDLGKTLKEVESSVLKAEAKDVVTRWYHSSRDADLFYWMDREHNILKQQLSFFGQIVEWNVVEGVKTGVVIEDERLPNKSRSELLRFDAQPQLKTLDQAVALLKAIPELRSGERERLLENLLDPRRPVEMDPEEFLARFSHFLNAESTPKSPAPTGLWTRVVRRVRRLFKG